jgi:hypothetical protein
MPDSLDKYWLLFFPHYVSNVLKTQSLIVPYVFCQLSSHPADQKHVAGV